MFLTNVEDTFIVSTDRIMMVIIFSMNSLEFGLKIQITITFVLRIMINVIKSYDKTRLARMNNLGCVCFKFIKFISSNNIPWNIKM